MTARREAPSRRSKITSSPEKFWSLVRTPISPLSIRILEGTQSMTVYKPLSSQAKLAAEAAVASAKGEAAKTTAAVSIGNKTIPAILLNPVVVTKDNVKQTVIKDGFQNLETIQKSLPKEKWPH